MQDRFVSGLDLGQTRDYSALVIVNERGGVDNESNPARVYDVRFIHRFDLLTPYPAVVSWVRDKFAGTVLQGSSLVVDQTGVGRAVVDLFADSGIAAKVHPYTITGGRLDTADTVPKIELVSTLVAVLGTRRLKINSRLPLGLALAKEMEMFRVKVTAERNQTFEAMREKDHDDMLLALMLAVWWAENHQDRRDAYGGASGTALGGVRSGTFRTQGVRR